MQELNIYSVTRPWLGDTKPYVLDQAWIGSVNTNLIYFWNIKTGKMFLAVSAVTYRSLAVCRPKHFLRMLWVSNRNWRYVDEGRLIKKSLEKYFFFFFLSLHRHLLGKIHFGGLVPFADVRATVKASLPQAVLESYKKLDFWEKEVLRWMYDGRH